MSVNDSGGYFDETERRRAEMRGVVSEIAAHIDHLPGAATAPKSGLPESWERLVKLLDLGDAREVKPCPACGNINMRAATRCGRCWIPLDAQVLGA